MRFNDHVNPKVKVEVELTTVDDRRLRGKLYLAGDQRVSDLMNLQNPFVPFVTSDGNLLILNKSIIACIQILEAEVAMRRPHAISSEPLRHAEIRCNAASPDRNEHK
ncbi:MAG: hypothetical protein IH892_08865 [Planctomycetes bacterium]|nr:hypothetical protein [Planctomycetota bacterium]